MKPDVVLDRQSRGTAGGLFWNAVGIITRQLSLIASAIILARILGPDQYAVVALAGIYTAFSTLLLDQGLTAPLISKKTITSRFVGAATTLNILTATVIAIATILAATSLAQAMNNHAIASVLIVLAVALPLKAISIAPRAIVARSIDFKTQAKIDVASSLVGIVAMLTCIAFSPNHWAFVAQVIACDATLALGLVILVRPPLPNFQMTLLSDSFAFGGRVLASNILAYSVQNLDNLLIGRYLGPSSLSLYSVSYRLVTMPVQLVGQILSRVLFPAISNRRDDILSVVELVRKAILATGVIVLPFMAFISVASGDIVQVMLGSEWSAAALTLTIFAVAGGRQAVTTLNSPILMGMDSTGVLLKFSLFAATIQISAIILGLQWGINGVATCFTIAGFLLTPVIMYLQKRTISMTYTMQLSSVGPGLHCVIWVVLANLLFRATTTLSSSVTLLLSLAISVVVWALILVLFHRAVLKEISTVVRRASNRSNS